MYKFLNRRNICAVFPTGDGFLRKTGKNRIDKREKPDKIIGTSFITLIKSGGGNGPMNPRQPAYDKVPNPAVIDR